MDEAEKYNDIEEYIREIDLLVDDYKQSRFEQLWDEVAEDLDEEIDDVTEDVEDPREYEAIANRMIASEVKRRIIEEEIDIDLTPAEIEDLEELELSLVGYIIGMNEEKEISNAELEEEMEPK